MKPLIRNNEASFDYCLIPHPTPEKIISTHIHNSYELLFFYDGDADYSIAGSIYHLHKNDLLLVPPSTYHNIILLSSHPYKRIVLNFYESSLPSDMRAILRTLGSFFHVDNGSPLELLFKTLLLSQPVLSEKEFDRYLSFTIPLIVTHLQHIDKKALQKRQPPHSTIEKIISYIDENPMLPLSLAKLSKTFFLSESHISHLFKQHFNISATQYINRKRISYAQSLIIAGQPPAQVSELCSYESYTTFYRHYKKYLGISPTQSENERQKIQKELL